MKSKLAAEWKQLRRGKPGRRFRESYDLARGESSRRTLSGRIVRISLAVVAMAIGVVLVFIPGPAVLFFAIGGALLATESRAVARLLDWIELRLRAVFRWAQRMKGRLFPGGK